MPSIANLHPIAQVRKQFSAASVSILGAKAAVVAAVVIASEVLLRPVEPGLASAVSLWTVAFGLRSMFASWSKEA